MQPGEPVLPGRKVLLVGLLLAIFGIAFEMIGVAAALPTVMAELQAAEHYAWSFSTMVTGMLLATMISGRVADRHGPLWPLFAGTLLFAIGLLLGAIAPNAVVLLLGRFIQGLGGGALNLGLFVVIALAWSAAERPGVLALISFAWLLPAFIGPPIAAELTKLSWRWVFALMLPLVAVAVLLAAPSMKRVQARFVGSSDTGRLPAWAILLVAAAPIAVQLAGQGLGTWSLLAGIGGVAALVIGLPAVLPPTIRLQHRGLGAVMLTRALQAGCFFAGEAFLLLALKDLRGLELFEAGISLTIGSLGWTCGSWLQSRAWVKLRRDQLIALGSAMSAAGLLVITFFVAISGIPLLIGVLGWVVAGGGMGLMMPSTAVATMSLSANDQQGRHNSALQLTEGLGNALFTGLVGAIYAVGLRETSQQPAFTWVFIALTAIAALALLTSRRIGRLTG